MGRHVIVDTNGPRVRLAGVFTDEQFHALPFVKQYGCFPKGLHAGHFGDGDDMQARHYLAMPESTQSARDVLALALKEAKARQYALVQCGQVVSYHGSQSAARKAMRQAVRQWRRVDKVGERVGIMGGTYGVWRQHGTAVSMTGTEPWHTMTEAGYVEGSDWYMLRRRSRGQAQTAGTLYIRHVDPRSVEARWPAEQGAA